MLIIFPSHNQDTREHESEEEEKRLLKNAALFCKKNAAAFTLMKLDR